MSISNKIIAATALSFLTVVAPAAVFAKGPTSNAEATYNASTSVVADAKTLSDCEVKNGVTGLIQNATLAQIQAVGNCEINTRNIYLQAYETRINQMDKISSSTQSTLEANLQSTLSTLATIKTSLNTDTATTSAFADLKTITQNVRVFELVLPKTRITADVSSQTTASANIQTLVSGLMTKNNNASPSVQAANAPLFADITAKLATIASNTSSALTTILPLVPDQGNKTLLQSNSAAIDSAQAMIKNGQTALKSIWTDIKQIRTNLHA